MAKVLVLGGYGLIGAHVARELRARGHDVVALGRDVHAARRVLPGYRWIIRDLRDLTTPADWAPLVAGVEYVVNCAGALQTNPSDDLELVHLTSVSALVLACEKAGVSLVQISAIGADAQSPLPYLRTKAEGDALIRESNTLWWIYRPGLVIAPTSYGGTTMIRVLAGVPMIQPIALPETRVQTVSVQDVAIAVARAVEGAVPPGTIADLVEDEAHRLVDIVEATRRWIGFPAAGRTLTMPEWLLRVLGRINDVVGAMGWRSPLTTSAINNMARGVRGEARQTRAVLGRPALSLEETFHAMPSRVEDRMFSRMQLLGPFMIFALGMQWIFSGAIGIIEFNDALEMLEAPGLSQAFNVGLVYTTSVITLALGIMVFHKRWARRALVVMSLFSIFYLAAGTILLPNLWLDPMGPLVKVFPIMVLALAGRVVLDTR